MALTETVKSEARAEDVPRRQLLGSWWAIVGFGLLLLLALGWLLIIHPTWTAPTRDPAWYTWRANVILDTSPGSIAREWGPDAVFSGGYRVTAPLAGALLERVADVDTYSFSAILMVGIPVLAGLALGAAGYRSRKDPLIVPVAMLATAAMFLTVPYVGYLDDLTMLFLLCVSLAFVAPARTSWGARTALLLIGIASAFAHPTTCVLFGITLLGVFAAHFLTSRFSLASALKSDGPMLMSVGFGMIFGLAMWLVGIWGPRAKLSDAAAPPPYTKAFFFERLKEWVASLQPAVTVPLMLVAIVGLAMWCRRERRPADQYDLVSAWWLLPLAGALTFLVSSKPVPYYRFLNASAAPIVLTGLGAYVAIRWFLRASGRARIAGVAASLVVIGALGWVLVDGLQHRWTSERNQWVDESARTSLAAVNRVAQAAGARPIVLVVNHGNTDDATGTNTAYGWAKTFTNVFRTGLPGASTRYQATYLGTLDDFLADRPSTGPSAGYRKIARDYWNELRRRMREFPAAPVVFVIGQYYGGSGDTSLLGLDGESIGPDVTVITKSGAFPLWTPPTDVVARAKEAAATKAAALADHPGAFGNPLHLLRVLFGLFFLAVLPGLLAAPFFELEDMPSRVALIPAMSIVLSLLSGIALLAVWRGSLNTTKAWGVVAVASLAGLGLRFGRSRILAVLSSFGAFFNKMFAVFSNRSFAALMGTQFVAQAADGMVQASLAKTIAFGGKEGFDITTAPSTRYLLVAVLLLYVPYTLVSPFMGVFIDRSDRRRLLVGSNLFRAAVIGLVALLLAVFGASLPSGVLIVGILVALACTRILLAIKSAGLPAVLSGRDLLQANGLSQAGGAVFQVMGGGVALVATAIAPSWTVALAGAAMYGVAGIVALRVERLEFERRTGPLVDELSRVFGQIRSGLREVFSRPAAALGLTSFQALRMEFFGFVALVFALEARFLLAGKNGDKTAVAVAGATGALGAAIGMVLAQKLKDRVPPARLLVAAMSAVGVGVILFGGVQSIVGYGSLTFVGAMGFFLGKISADTIMQQSLPDGFRGRGFSLFDIAYNLGWIVPALILAIVWDGSRVRLILIASGVVFLVVTALVARWAARIKDQLAPQDDLVRIE